MLLTYAQQPAHDPAVGRHRAVVVAPASRPGVAPALGDARPPTQRALDGDPGPGGHVGIPAPPRPSWRPWGALAAGIVLRVAPRAASGAAYALTTRQGWDRIFRSVVQPVRRRMAPSRSGSSVRPRHS